MRTLKSIFLNFYSNKGSLSLLLSIIIAIIISSCSSSPYPGYEQSDNGLYYNIVEDKDTEKPVEGDFLKVNIQYVTMSDSVIFDSKDEVHPVWISIERASFHGDIMEGISMLSVGDSASFIVRVDTFYVMTIGAVRIPEFALQDSMMYVNIRVLESKTKEEFEQERQLIEEDIQVQLETLRLKEIEDLKNYIEINNISQIASESGLIFIPMQYGNAIPIREGQKVICHYTGTFIDGQIFDSSSGLEPLQVTIGAGEVIDGFDEALRLMSKGAKAKAIIPSDIGFGTSEFNSPIPPYATLIFEIEIIDVID